MDYWLGCDMGKHVDYSALTVLARTFAISPSTGLPMRNSQGFPLYAWRIRGIHRFPLRTSYDTVAEMVAEVAAIPALRNPRVALDSTGVGISTTETVRAATRELCPDVEVWGCSITAGEGWRHSGRHMVNVAKSQLTGTLRSALEGGRLRIARRVDGSLPKGSDLLLNELRAFRVRTSSTGTDVYGAASSKHDDIVLSLCLPTWLASLPFMSLDRNFSDMPTAIAAEQQEAFEVEQEIRAEEDKARMLAEDRAWITPPLKWWQAQINPEVAADFHNPKYWT